jgi:hypothetical protein
MLSTTRGITLSGRVDRMLKDAYSLFSDIDMSQFDFCDGIEPTDAELMMIESEIEELNSIMVV